MSNEFRPLQHYRGRNLNFNVAYYRVDAPMLELLPVVLLIATRTGLRSSLVLHYSLWNGGNSKGNILGLHASMWKAAHFMLLHKFNT